MKFSWLDILIVILSVLAIYLLSTRVFGHSATEIQITLALFSLLFTIGYKAYASLQRQVSNINREVGEIKTEIKNLSGKIDKKE